MLLIGPKSITKIPSVYDQTIRFVSCGEVDPSSRKLGRVHLDRGCVVVTDGAPHTNYTVNSRVGNYFVFISFVLCYILDAWLSLGIKIIY